MINVEVINIDGIEYFKQEENNNYVLLVNIEDGHDYLIQKKLKENDKLYYTSLDSEDEFDKAFKELMQKDAN